MWLLYFSVIGCYAELVLCVGGGQFMFYHHKTLSVEFDKPPNFADQTSFLLGSGMLVIITF